MATSPLTLTSYPRAILHIDADAFFTSVEQALDAKLQGRPIVTGKERGIISCASYEAKALGIKRGVALHEAKRICPDLLILPDDYETYGLYSQRMFDIIRDFSPSVEVNSIDEAYVDITGLQRLHKKPYAEIAENIRASVRQKLGITVSIGLSITKSLAKICSRYRKPDGFTGVEGRHIHLLLNRTPVQNITGIGGNSAALLNKQGIITAYDFVMKSEAWVRQYLHKPGVDMWNELRGRLVSTVDPAASSKQKKSILRSKTFTPPSTDRDLVYAKLMANHELAFETARRHNLKPRSIVILLRRQDFSNDAVEATLSRPTNITREVTPRVKALFDEVFRENTPYRSTLVALCGLTSNAAEQGDLFDDRLRMEKNRRITLSIDEINREFGRHSIEPATLLHLQREPESDRYRPPERKLILMPGESPKRRINLPRMDLKI